MRLKKLLLWILPAVLMGWLSGPTWAETRLSIVVKTVLASNDSTHIDPRIPGLTQKLQSVFRYSSYRLLSQDSLDIGMGETGTVSLPGKREMKITPVRIMGNRVELKLLIFKKKRQIIQSTIQILNHGSIVVGGPQHKGGYLLFDIFNSF